MEMALKIKHNECQAIQWEVFHPCICKIAFFCKEKDKSLPGFKRAKSSIPSSAVPFFLSRRPRLVTEVHLRNTGVKRLLSGRVISMAT